MKLYDDIESAIRRHRTSLEINEVMTLDEVKQAIRQVLRDNPDIFWFAHNANYDEQTKTLSLGYLFSKDRVTLLQESIADVVENDFQIAKVRELPTCEQVLYVYNWIISYCNYNINSAFNQEIDSVFVRRNSVCTGYAKAAQYLFHLLGIESILVFGKLNKDASLNGRHCWNLVKVGKTYYHLDVSLGDPVNAHLLNEEPKLINGCTFNCYCVSTEEILKTRSIEQIETLPESPATVIEISPLAVSKRQGNRGCLLSPIGSSADIYLCSTDKHIVLKQFRKNSVTSCRFEYGIMRRLVGCQHTIQLNEHYTDVCEDVLAIEQSTPLLDLFFSRNFEFSVSSLLKMAKDIATAWLECKSRGVIYRDIHPCNIYRANDGSYKLGDFGSCTTDMNATERVGNEWFMSPNIYWGRSCFDDHSAIYSISMVMYFILNGLQPIFWNKGNERYALQARLCRKELPMPRMCKGVPSTNLLLELVVMGYRSDIHSIPQFVSAIQSALSYYSKNNFKLKFVHSDFDFEGTLSTINEFARQLTLSGSTINNIESRCTTDIPFLENGNVDQTETYCCTRGGVVSYAPSAPPKSDVTYEPHYDRKVFASLPKSGMIDVVSLISSSFLAPIRAIVKGFGKLPHSSSKSRTPIYSKVFSSIFAPTEVKRHSHLLVQVYLHSFDDTDKVKYLATESNKNAERRGYIPLQCVLKDGDKVDVHLNIYGDTLLFSERKSLIWQGSITNCAFDYIVPNDIDVDELSCMALITNNGTPIGEMRFLTQIVTNPRHINTKIVARQFKKVFISYSHKDEEKVRSFHKGLELSGIDHFFDRAYLKAGDIFPQVIQDYINSADLFVLFWSENASNSEYVEKERKQALQRAFPQVKPQDLAKLTIYPMSIEPRADLPEDMKENYHFGEI